MTDLDAMKQMLDRADIPYEQVESPTEEDSLYAGPLPQGAVSLMVRPTMDPPRRQPHDGGYVGFFTEMVFDAEGMLLAVWAWE